MSTLQELLGLPMPGVAVAFTNAPPEDVPHASQVGPASCSYWRLAADGHTFFTRSEDHHGCPVGAFTHAVALPAEGQAEQREMLGQMVSMGYLDEEEIALIPHREAPLDIAVYGPLTSFPPGLEPDVVLLRGNARQMMVAAEAARAAGVPVHADGPMLRPTCAVLPVSEGGAAALSLACVGNRVYTSMGDDEVVLSIPGSGAEAVLSSLPRIIDANRQLETFHRDRLAGV